MPVAMPAWARPVGNEGRRAEMAEAQLGSAVWSGDGDALRRVTPSRIAMVLTLLVLNVADVLLTRAVIDRGGIEGNPLMRDLMSGLAAPLGVKVLLPLVAGGLLLCCPPRSRLAERAVLAVIGLYVLTVGWNAGLLVWLGITS